jgi:hypothetical protein
VRLLDQSIVKKTWDEPQASPAFITVISGYPRSGTSLMMQMLAAGGIDVLCDDFRKPDEHNPRGYYEFEHALKLGGEGETTDWVAQAVGRAVKVIAYQMRLLPIEYNYRVIFMRRKIVEVLASSRKMKLTREQPALSEREQILAFKTEYVVYEAWLLKQPNMCALFVNYNDLLANPREHIERVSAFLGVPLDVDEMIKAIDPALYRNRG